MKNKTNYEVPVFRLQLVQEGICEAGPITDPKELVLQLEDVAKSDREQMIAVFLSTKNQIIGRQTVSIGTLNTSLVHAREVFKGAILANANAVILAHNHPSGDTTPSKEDDQITKAIAKSGEIIGISVLDHIILGANKSFYSYKQENGELLQGGHQQ
jgi:DNA repair protein RadC